MRRTGPTGMYRSYIHQVAQRLVTNTRSHEHIYPHVLTVCFKLGTMPGVSEPFVTLSSLWFLYVRCLPAILMVDCGCQLMEFRPGLGTFGISRFRPVEEHEGNSHQPELWLTCIGQFSSYSYFESRSTDVSRCCGRIWAQQSYNPVRA